MVKKKPAAAGNPVRMPGRRICGGRPALLTGPARCPWPRGSSSKRRFQVSGFGCQIAGERHLEAGVKMVRLTPEH